MICEFLDTIGEAAPLCPPSGPARWRTLVLHAAADEMLDAALLARYETALRPEVLRWPEWTGGQMAKIDSTLDAFEANWLAHLHQGIDIGRDHGRLCFGLSGLPVPRSRLAHGPRWTGGLVRHIRDTRVDDRHRAIGQTRPSVRSCLAQEVASGCVIATGIAPNRRTTRGAGIRFPQMSSSHRSAGVASDLRRMEWSVAALSEQPSSLGSRLASDSVGPALLPQSPHARSGSADRPCPEQCCQRRRQVNRVNRHGEAARLAEPDSRSAARTARNPDSTEQITDNVAPVRSEPRGRSARRRQE